MGVNGVEVVDLGPADFGGYTDLVEGTAELGFYYSLEWHKLLDLLVPGSRCTRIAKSKSGEVVGCLPIYVTDGKFGLVYNSLPFFGSYGNILGRNLGVTTALAEDWDRLISGPDVLSGTVIENPMATSSYQSVLTHNCSDTRLCQYQDLSQYSGDPDRIVAGVQPRQRSVLRKGIGQEYIVDYASDNWEFIRKCHRLRMTSIGGTPKPDEFFSYIPEVFKHDSQYRIWTLYHNRQPISAVLLFYWQDTVEYYLPVVDEEHRSSQASRIVIYHAMRDAVGRGYKIWNWGGTRKSQEGLHRFKSSWGAKDTEYVYFTQVNRERIYGIDPEELLQCYPYFYVVPF